MRPLLRRIFFHHRRGYRSIAFLLVGALSLGTYAVVDRIPDSSVPRGVLEARRAAVAAAIRGQEVIRNERSKLRLAFNPGDTFHTGMIGVTSSAVTTELGSLPSHRTSTDPVFAAAVVQLLHRAGVRRGDLVAVGSTGSYPGFNLDVEVAIESLGARPLSITALGSSEYGANEPKLTWPAMESALLHAGVIRYGSAAVAAGGSLAGKDAITRRQLAERTGLPVVPLLPPTDEIHYLIHRYVTAANRLGKPIRAFVNVGGASANVGSGGAESIIKPGLWRPHLTPYQASKLGVVGWMAERGIPIVAMLSVRSLAKKFAIPYDPHLQDTARDLPPPPANPIGLVLALIGLLVVVVVVHRLGFFRVPTWDLPEELRQASKPGHPTSSASVPAQDREPPGRTRVGAISSRTTLPGATSGTQTAASNAGRPHQKGKS
jgi:poly-gamma-glutamate system protein